VVGRPRDPAGGTPDRVGPATGTSTASPPTELLQLDTAAVDCLARSVRRAVLATKNLGVPSWRELWGDGSRAVGAT
jgi:hypothetical protein